MSLPSSISIFLLHYPFPSTSSVLTSVQPAFLLSYFFHSLHLFFHPFSSSSPILSFLHTSSLSSSFLSFFYLHFHFRFSFFTLWKSFLLLSQFYSSHSFTSFSPLAHSSSPPFCPSFNPVFLSLPPSSFYISCLYFLPCPLRQRHYYELEPHSFL